MTEAQRVGSRLPVSILFFQVLCKDSLAVTHMSFVFLKIYRSGFTFSKEVEKESILVYSFTNLYIDSLDFYWETTGYQAVFLAWNN